MRPRTLMGRIDATRPRAVFATAIVLTLASAQTALGEPCFPRWRSGEPIPGLAGGGAKAMIVFDDGTGPALYIGGDFWAAGSLPDGGLVRWDGHEWSSVGGAAREQVDAFTVHEGRLICAGYFPSIGGVAAQNVAAWDGTSWTRLGSGSWTSARVRAITSYQGRLVAAGDFALAGGVFANHIAQWDGNEWSPLGGGLDGDVYALLSFGEDLIAGGDFTTASGVPAKNVARWDGTSWSALGSLPGGVRALTSVDPDGAGPLPERIAAGGLLTSRWLATWNGATWETFAGGPTSTVLSLLRTDDGLVAGGVFTSTQSLGASRIARWSSSGGWSALGSGIDPGVAIGGTVECVAEFQGDVYAGGWFHSDGDIAMHHVARWNGERWHALGPGLGGDRYAHVWTLAEHERGVVVGGRFASVGSALVANNIALRTPNGWESLGAGLGRPNHDAVLSVATHEGQVHAAWQDASSRSEPGRLSRWTQTTWEPLGSGNREIRALLSAGDDVYAGGGFTSLTDALGRTTEANRVARFDGETFHALGAGLGDRSGDVLALTMFRGNLVAAGTFTSAGGVPAMGIARWDAGAWRPLGAGLRDVTDVAVHRGALFASNADGVHRWDDGEWTLVVDMTAEYSGIVYSLASAGPDLYFTGQFGWADDVEAAGIARWDGASTHPVGDGLVGGIGYALQAVPGKSIAVGGTFFLAGGRVSQLFARFQPCEAPAAVASDDRLDGDDGGHAPATLGVDASNESGADPVLRLSVPASGRLTLAVHDVAGRRVGGAVDLGVEAGTRSVAWHELVGRFARTASGVYFVRAELRSAGGSETRTARVVVVR
jgi:hypothetical protein